MTNVSQIVADVPPEGLGTFHAGRFIGASAAISAIRLCGRGALFAAALIASRHLSPSSFGIYVYVLTFFTAVNLVGALGLEQSALIALGRGRAAGDSVFIGRVLSKIVRRAILTLPVASLVFAVPVSWVLPSLSVVCCFVLSGCCLTAIVVAAGVLRGLDYPVASSIVQESGRGLVIFLGVITLYFGWQLQGVWISTLVLAALFAFFGIAAATSASRKLLANVANNAAAARHSAQHDVHLPAQFRFLLVLIATNAFLWLCPVILKRYAATITEVALFNVAMQYPSLLSFISTSLEMIYVPKIASAWQAGRIEDVRPLLRIGSRVTIAACVPIGAVLALFWRPLLAFYGPEYSRAGLAMLLIATAQLLSAACGPCGYMVLLTGRENLNLLGMALSATAGIIAIFFLAAPYGHLGAAFAFLLSTALSNLLFAAYCIRKLNVDPTILAAFRPVQFAARRESQSPCLPLTSNVVSEGSPNC